jgi:hypothetical protein
MQFHSTVAASALLSVILVKVEKRRPVNNSDELRFEAGPASRRGAPRPQRRLASRQSPRGLASETGPAPFAQSLTRPSAGATPAGMKLLILSICAAGVCLAGDTTEAPISPVGRFSLFQGESVTVLPNNHTITVKNLWKLDTCTGRAWHFFSGSLSNGVASERWVETFDQLTSYTESKSNDPDEP